MGEIRGPALGIKGGGLLHGLPGFRQAVQGGQGQARLKFGRLGHLGVGLGPAEIVQGQGKSPLFGLRHSPEESHLTGLKASGLQGLQERQGFFGFVQGQQGVGQQELDLGLVGTQAQGLFQVFPGLGVIEPEAMGPAQQEGLFPGVAPFLPGLVQLCQGFIVIFLLQISGRLLHQHIIVRADP